MNGFIEIVGSDQKRRLINVRHIEEVVELDENSCSIYMAFNTPDAYEQDYFKVKKPYSEIVALIEKAVN
jgi:hypothetical protein